MPRQSHQALHIYSATRSQYPTAHIFSHVYLLVAGQNQRAGKLRCRPRFAGEAFAIDDVCRGWATEGVVRWDGEVAR